MFHKIKEAKKEGKVYCCRDHTDEWCEIYAMNDDAPTINEIGYLRCDDYNLKVKFLSREILVSIVTAPKWLALLKRIFGNLILKIVREPPNAILVGCQIKIIKKYH